MLLTDHFKSLLKSFNVTQSTIDTLWGEIETHYSEGHRYYHTLEHLDNVLKELIEVKDSIEDWEVLLFSLFYHDIIYDTQKSNNELKSAEFAEKRLQTLRVPKEKIEKCKAVILATSSHELSDDHDINCFLDVDLSVLGRAREVYEKYSEDIRKEYSNYPDLLYRPGRKKILTHFLGMDRIFKTKYFSEKFEVQARKNLQWELENVK
ncbi:MAG: hypothetical protein KJO05_11345 [Bacteroidia bacterium]|nr:hypothetical protein [Bacteroidia bacterium]NNF31015.1 hypothetical protein [Flavobacteriaceae bacterium]MBT8276865.1 hypothetical protein [Bacteroidia bacterium]NNJ82435.1 hypothetical protein [Flavobacteriaceae bacterium]NNK53083.1 hypothetical protein [Flavobacteriaceae bacterium]